MSTLIVKPTGVFVTADVVRLYPNINIAKCIVLLYQFVQERITAADPTIDMDSSSLALFHDIMEIVLQENYCHFADRVFKAVKGFPTGIACGRSCAEIYLHMLERHLWTLFRPHITFFRRYIDDFQGVFTSEGPVRAFINAYGNLDDSVQITADVSETSFVMLDTRAVKGEQWKETGLLDLQLYQKPDSAFQYIPVFSDHPQHVLRAFIYGECIRIAKRNTSELIFMQHRELFRHRLLARGYQHKFIGSIFSRVKYADRYKFLFERHEAAKYKSSMSLQTDTEIRTPALIALSLQHSQRADALGIAQAIFSAKSEFLLEQYGVPEVLRTATYIHARKSGVKLGDVLIEYRYPRQYAARI